MSRKLNSAEIIKLLDILIGQTEAVGETNADEVILENLKTLIDVTNWCIDGIHQSSGTVGRPEASMHKIGWTAQCALDDYRVWLTAVLKER